MTAPEDDGRTRLVHVVPNLEVGGAEMLVDRWIRRLDPARYRSSAICLDGLGPLGERLRRDGHPVATLGAGPGLRLSTVRRLAAELRRERADVIHAHTYSPLVFAAFARLLYRRPRLVYTEHGRLHPEPRRPKRRYAAPFLAAMTHELVSISEATRGAMARHDGLPLGRIRVIHNGVELPGPAADAPDPAAMKRELGLPADALVCGMAARLVALKNVKLAVRAFDDVRRRLPAARLVVAGDGPERPDLERRVAEAGLADHVRFLGMRDDLARVYRAYDVFLLCSLTEGISVTMLETMAQGIPSVATRVGGNPEVVADGETGLLVESEDAAGLAGALSALLGDAGRRREMGRAAARRARERFSLETMFARYEELYRG